MNRLLMLVVLLGWLGSSAQAAEICYSGGHESGQLQFHGAVEGSRFSGGFGEFRVRYCMPEAGPEQGSIEVEVQLASADSRNRDRDEALRDEEFFDIDNHPVSTWRSTSIAADGGDYTAAGELSLKGITAGQAIRFTLDPDGERITLSGGFTLAGDAEIDRQRFEIGTGEFADPEFVRNRVDVTFEVELGAGE